MVGLFAEMIEGSRGPRDCDSCGGVRSQVDWLATRWTSKVRNYDASMGHRSLHSDDAVETNTGLNRFAVEWETEEGQ